MWKITELTKILAISTVAICCCISVVGGKLPSTIPICHRNDPEITNCIINSINALKPQLASGDLGDGLIIPKLEPFYVKSIKIGRSADFKILLKNLTIYGASGFKVEKLRVNLDDFKVDTIVTFPKLEIIGKYDTVIKLFGQNINYRDGEGHTIVENSRARVAMKGNLYERDGKEFLKFEKFRIKVQTGKIRQMKLTQLIGANGAIEEAANAFIQANSDFMLANVYPSIEKYLADLLTEIANEIVDKASFDELFL